MRLGSKLLGEGRVGINASRTVKAYPIDSQLGDPYCAYVGEKVKGDGHEWGHYARETLMANSGVLILAYQTRSPKGRAVLSWERFLNGKTTGHD